MGTILTACGEQVPVGGLPCRFTIGAPTGCRRAE